MPYRLTKIYTRKGDQGFTHIRDERVSKDDLLVEVVGTIDELNAVLGFALSLQENSSEIQKSLTHVQNELFDLGGELHAPAIQLIDAGKVTALEKLLDQWNKPLPPLTEFVLPRGNPQATAMHVARTVCRRAERCLVKLHRKVPIKNPEMLRYLNRLSDLLFVAARVVARANNETEQLWEH